MTIATADQSADQRTVVFTVTGRLSAVNVEELRVAVADAVGRGRIRIVLDLRDVDFIDSSGLGGVISGLKTARQAGGDLRLVAPGEQVMMILRLTNLDEILPIFPTIDAAAADDAA